MVHAWNTSFPGTITVCEPEGIILAMNNKAIEAFNVDGGKMIFGTSLLNCHPEPARAPVEEIPRTRRQNSYAMETNVVKNLIYQTPWSENEGHSGFIEPGLPLPSALPQFIRMDNKG